MKLYYNPLSTYCHKVMIAFNEKGIAYEPHVVDLMSAEGRAAFEKIYPFGKVPFFKPSEDWQVPESTSIIEYLEDKFPNTPRLIPAGGGDAARQVRFMDRMADFYLNDPIGELLFQDLGFRAKDNDKAARARKHVGTMFEYFEKRLAKQPWLCGESFTMADCAAIPALFYAQTVMPFDAHSNIVAYWQRALKRPSYAKVKAELDPNWQGMISQRSAA